MNRFIVATLLALILGTRPVQAQTDDTGLLRTCETQITAKFKQWRLAPVSKEVAEAARNSHENPTMVSGDFDADKRRDVALLIQDGPSPDPDYPRRLDSMHIAVCLNTADRVQLLLIDRPYCGDGIALAPQGQPITISLRSRKASTNSMASARTASKKREPPTSSTVAHFRE